MTGSSGSGVRRISARILLALGLAIGSTGLLINPAGAVSGQIGNAAVDRSSSDTWINFVAVDTNNPAPFDGYFTSITYYAKAPGDIRFAIVDSTDEVTWISDTVTAESTGVHVATFEPVGVTAGSNLGVYSPRLGVVSFDYDAAAADAQFTNYDSGLPDIGDQLAYVSVGNGHRWYSMNATIEASSPQICKDGGWEQYGYPNQGQCIASIVANEHSGK